MLERFHYERIDSTNLQALRLWQARRALAPAQPLLVTAERQDAGIGRLGRTWNSPTGGVWMSLAWPLKNSLAHYQALPLAVGLAVAKAVEDSCGVACQIKWPNDLLVRGRKLAGILCQAPQGEFTPVSIIGVGVNGNYPAVALGPGLRQTPTSLADEMGRPADLADLLDRMMRDLQAALQDFDARGLNGSLELIRRRLAWVDRLVTCAAADGSGQVEGRLVGLDALGQLILEINGQARPMNAGELSAMDLVDSPA